MTTLEPLLSEHPFFRGMSPQHLELLAGCASNVRFDADDYVCREGEEADRFYLICHGRLRLEIHVPAKQPVIIDTIDGGDVLGWSWLFPPYHWHFDAVAMDLVRATALDGICLRKKCDDDHDLGYEMTKRIGRLMEERLKATRLRLLDMYGA